PVRKNGFEEEAYLCGNRVPRLAEMVAGPQQTGHRRCHLATRRVGGVDAVLARLVDDELEPGGARSGEILYPIALIDVDCDEIVHGAYPLVWFRLGAGGLTGSSTARSRIAAPA